MGKLEEVQWGVLCDRKMLVKLKEKIYPTVVRPALGQRQR